MIRAFGALAGVVVEGAREESKGSITSDVIEASGVSRGRGWAGGGSTEGGNIEWKAKNTGRSSESATSDMRNQSQQNQTSESEKLGSEMGRVCQLMKRRGEMKRWQTWGLRKANVFWCGRKIDTGLEKGGQKSLVKLMKKSQRLFLRHVLKISVRNAIQNSPQNVKRHPGRPSKSIWQKRKKMAQEKQMRLGKISICDE